MWALPPLDKLPELRILEEERFAAEVEDGYEVLVLQAYEQVATMSSILLQVSFPPLDFLKHTDRIDPLGFHLEYNLDYNSSRRAQIQ